MNNKEEVFVTNSFEETQRLGEKFIKDILRLHLRGGSVNVALYGDLGSGKTTFAQGVAKGLGIERRIISPTFIIVRRYELQAKSSKPKSQNYNSKLKSLERFYHIDLYRIQGEKDLESLGLQEIMEDPESIVVIEWAEKLGSLLPEKRWDLRFEYLGEDKRRIAVSKISNF